MKQRKRPNPFLSRARSFWRLAAKKKIEGDKRQADWYGWQAQKALNDYYKSTGRFEQSE